MFLKLCGLKPEQFKPDELNCLLNQDTSCPIGFDDVQLEHLIADLTDEIDGDHRSESAIFLNRTTTTYNPDAGTDIR